MREWQKRSTLMWSPKKGSVTQSDKNIFTIQARQKVDQDDCNLQRECEKNEDGWLHTMT